MSATKIAEPYAEALLELSDSSKKLTTDMNVVSQFLATSSDLKNFLGNHRKSHEFLGPKTRQKKTRQTSLGHSRVTDWQRKSLSEQRTETADQPLHLDSSYGVS